MKLSRMMLIVAAFATASFLALLAMMYPRGFIVVVIIVCVAVAKIGTPRRVMLSWLRRWRRSGRSRDRRRPDVPDPRTDQESLPETAGRDKNVFARRVDLAAAREESVGRTGC